VTRAGCEIKVSLAREAKIHTANLPKLVGVNNSHLCVGLDLQLAVLGHFPVSQRAQESERDTRVLSATFRSGNLRWRQNAHGGGPRTHSYYTHICDWMKLVRTWVCVCLSLTFASGMIFSDISSPRLTYRRHFNAHNCTYLARCHNCGLRIKAFQASISN
jgi:hypothetical protein